MVIRNKALKAEPALIDAPPVEEVLEQEPEQPTGPRVTVIIPSFHRAPMLRKCLQALEKSDDHERQQVIVLDIGTHDTTPAWDLDFPQFTFLRMPRNFGVTKAMNIGARSAKAELLLYLDPAVEVQPGTIVRLASAIDEMQEAGAVCPVLVDENGNPLAQVRRLPDRDTLWRVWQDESAIEASALKQLDEPMGVEYAGRQAIMVRLPFLKGMHYFNERYGEWGADLELAFQIRHASKKTFILPSARAIDHSAAESPLQWSNAQRATLTADRLSGVAHFLGKRAGFFPALLFRLQAILVTLLRALTFQDPGYNWSLLFGLLGAEKIDGSQGSI